MSKKSIGAEGLERAGYPASEYQAVKRMIQRLLVCSHANQIESVLAYLNHAARDSSQSASLHKAKLMLEEGTGIKSYRTLYRMSGNSLPGGNAPSAEFSKALSDTKRAILEALGQQHLLASIDCNYVVKGKAVYRGNMRVAICPTEQHAVSVAAAISAKE